MVLVRSATMVWLRMFLLLLELQSAQTKTAALSLQVSSSFELILGLLSAC